jgi:hypothetical protein
VATPPSDLDAIAIPPGVKFAGGLLMGAGIAIGVTGLQVLLFFIMPGTYQLVGPAAMMLAGGCVFFGWGALRARLQAAKLGLALAATTFVFACGWIMLAFTHGMISFPTLAVVPLSSLAYVILRRELPQIRKIDEARERLRAQGLDAGS